MPRSRKLYVSELLNRCSMINSPVVLKITKINETLWYETLKKAIEKLSTTTYWDKQVIKWYTVKTIEYIITIFI